MTDQFDLSKLSPEVRAELVESAEAKVRQVNSDQARAIDKAREKACSAEIVQQVKAIGGHPTQFQRHHIIDSAHRKFRVYEYNRGK